MPRPRDRQTSQRHQLGVQIKATRPLHTQRPHDSQKLAHFASERTSLVCHRT